MFFRAVIILALSLLAGVVAYTDLFNIADTAEIVYFVLLVVFVITLSIAYQRHRRG